MQQVIRDQLAQLILRQRECSITTQELSDQVSKGHIEIIGVQNLINNITMEIDTLNKVLQHLIIQPSKPQSS